MLAYQFTTWEQDFELQEMPTPEPGPGETLIRVAGAGVCHSDLYLCDWPRSSLPSYELPFTVGHEITGWVESSGPGGSDLPVGTPVAVYGAWGCNTCPQCAEQSENYCENAAAVVASGPGRPGLGRDGGIAEFFLAPQSRHLVPLPAGLDPVEAAPLTDAGLTTYHAIKQQLDRLHPGTTAVVIGIGGLGSLAVQILRALSAARVIAVDIASDRLEAARRQGAHHAVLADESAPGAIREATGGRGAELILDIVGTDDTLALAASAAAIRGHITVVGIGPGSFPMGYVHVPRGLSASTVFWGAIPDLAEVVALAGTGAIRSDTERFSMQQAPLAYRKLREGTLKGRAVVVPHGAEVNLP
ncbi:MAG: NAD(P)-dependent alcohol dehydrogenase [Actinomycetia bacterium]|nr:NAD(P)-dependent alcohol dehydrogenase [Actinomycetes bacterium]